MITCHRRLIFTGRLRFLPAAHFLRALDDKVGFLCRQQVAKLTSSVAENVEAPSSEVTRGYSLVPLKLDIDVEPIRRSGKPHPMPARMGYRLPIPESIAGQVPDRLPPE